MQKVVAIATEQCSLIVILVNCFQKYSYPSLALGVWVYNRKMLHVAKLPVCLTSDL